MAKTPAPTAFTATWMGVTTLLFDDGADAVLIDGFFTRPGYFSTFLSRIGPDEEVVARCLEKGGVVGDRLRAVLVAHSHWDHALDAPVVCRQTGAKLLGSDSTRMVGLGQGLPDQQIQVVQDGEILKYGAFRITIFEGVHSPGDVAPGEIEKPLQMPCGFREMRSGKCYSYLVEYGEQSQRVFVHPSANFVGGKFKGIKCPIVFLGLGVLGKQSDEFREAYWNETVAEMQPSRIVPVHWDNFFKPLDKPIVPMPWPLDNWGVTERWLAEKAKASGVEVHMPELWEVMDLTK